MLPTTFASSRFLTCVSDRQPPSEPGASLDWTLWGTTHHPGLMIARGSTAVVREGRQMSAIGTQETIDAAPVLSA